jgi:hypothetical protein
VPDLVPPLAALLPQTVTPYVALMLAGFAVGIFGHLAGWRWLVAAGVVLIALGAMLLPLVAHLAA